MTTENKCQAVLHGSRSWGQPKHHCDKPVKGTLADGTYVCGVHLAAERKRKEGLDAFRAEGARQDQKQALAKAACEAMAAVGIKAEPEYRRRIGSGKDFGYTGKVIVSHDDILSALAATQAS